MMKRGISSVFLILFLVLIIPFFSDFVNASLCGEKDSLAYCYNLVDQYECDRYYQCFWEMGASWNEYNCEAYGYCANSQTATCDQWGAEGRGYGFCYEDFVCNGDFLCSELDDTYESRCEEVGCTWYPDACKTADNCNTGQVCEGAESQCTGTWTDYSTKVDWEGLGYSAYANWVEGAVTLTCISTGGDNTVCQVCETCRADRDSKAHKVVNGRWYQLDCNGNYFLGICTSVEWVTSTYSIRSAYSTPSCTGFTTQSTCLTNHPGCVWDTTTYGTCVTPCVPTTYTPALNTFCGEKLVTDNCGTVSTKTGTLTCNPPQQCVDNACRTIETCTDDVGCTGVGTFCYQNSLITCTRGADGCLDKTSTTSCVDTSPCTNDACSLVGLSYQCTHTAIPNCCTSPSTCPTGTSCQTRTCTNNVCGLSTITSCTNNDGCCPSGCTYLNDNDCSCTVTSYTPALNTFCGTRSVTTNCGTTVTMTGTLTCISPNTCINNACGCLPTKTTCSALDCGMIPNGCGAYLNCGGCDTGEGTCISNSCTCVSEDYTGCYDNDVYYFDSCEKVETTNKFDECSDASSCTNDYCSGGKCVNEYICDCSSDSECNDLNSCTTDKCSGGYCDYTQKVCGADNDGCCQPGCTYPNDQDCPPPQETCGDGSINQGWEECDCGSDNICTLSEFGGETCSSLGYSGGSLTCSSCMITFGSCTSPCNLLDAYWQSTTTYLGNSVDLVVVGDSNCNGKSVTFSIKQNNFLGIPINIATAPTRTFSGTSATSVWTPTELSSRDGYYFVAELSDGSDKVTSNNMQVIENTGCGYGGCDTDAGENCNNCPQDCGACCPDGKCNYGETCSSCPGDCGSCDIPCGNGDCEEELGENCYNCPIDCLVCPPANCGDGTLNEDEGEECDDNNQVSGDGCSEYCKFEGECGNGYIELGEECDDNNQVSGDGCSYPECEDENSLGECEITETYWEKTTAFEGEEVALRVIGTSGCNEKDVSFIVMERDAFPNSNDPVNTEPSSIIFDSAITNYGYWTAEGQEDDDTDGGQTYPPEYYFTAIITSTGEDLESSNLLEVFDRDITCSGINYCSDYLKQEDCENDLELCDVGVNSVVGVTCGSVYNPITDCLDNINCGCAWDVELGICEGSWEAESICGGDPDEYCKPNEDECWLTGDLCQDDCTCFGTSTPNWYGSCDYTGYDVCDEYDECWLAGDLCTEECECFGTSIPDYTGACVVDPSAVCSEDDECWLAGDHCGDDCFCEYGYGPNGDGTCGDDNPNVCGEDDECWLAGDACQDDCTCFGNSIPDEYGACIDNPGEVCDEDDECWLAGDACQDDCTCFGTSTPNWYGSCDYTGYDVCDEDDECWLAGGHCGDDCFCENGYNPNNQGGCVSEGGSGGGTTIIRKKGTCFYTESGGDDCDDGYLTRILDAFWKWDESNRYAYSEIPLGQENNFIPDEIEYDIYRYDPQRESQMCIDLEDTFVCPASVEVPFFGVYQAVIAIAIIGLIYLIYVLRKKNHVKQSKKKTRKTSKKSRK